MSGQGQFYKKSGKLKKRIDAALLKIYFNSYAN